MVRAGREQNQMLSLLLISGPRPAVDGREATEQSSFLESIEVSSLLFSACSIYAYLPRTREIACVLCCSGRLAQGRLELLREAGSPTAMFVVRNLTSTIKCISINLIYFALQRSLLEPLKLFICRSFGLSPRVPL